MLRPFPVSDGIHDHLVLIDHLLRRQLRDDAATA
jgi:hypothetical protein